MYAKLFASLYQGTLRGRADEILVFTNLIAHADARGVVDKHWRSIAEETGITVDEVKAAILNLEAPDPESRSPDLGGARIVRMDEHRAWGWLIVNYGKYRAIRNEDDRRLQNREAQERFRQRKQSKPRKPMSAQAEAEAEAEEGRERVGAAGAAQAPSPTMVPADIAEAARARGRAVMQGQPLPDGFSPDQASLALVAKGRPDLGAEAIALETTKFVATVMAGNTRSHNWQQSWVKWICGTRIPVGAQQAGGGSEPIWKTQRKASVKAAIEASKGGEK